jgi:predicted nucleic acid-binding Zn ribbon protein
MNADGRAARSQEFSSIIKILAGKVRGYLALMVGGPVLKAALLLATIAALAALIFNLASSGAVSSAAAWGMGLVLLFPLGALVIKIIDIIVLFRPYQQLGTQVSREDSPELFGIIDDVAETLHCRKPRRVYVNEDCDAAVCYSSLLGASLRGHEILVIGLPMLSFFNRTELRAAVGQVLGQTVRESDRTYRMASMASLICEADRLDEIEKSGDRSLKGVMVGRIAPLYRRFIRFSSDESDLIAAMAAGTEGTVSMLSKQSYGAEIYCSVMNYVSDLMNNQQRRPESVWKVTTLFVNAVNARGGVSLRPQTHLLSPNPQAPERLLWQDKVLPSYASRCEAVRSRTAMSTAWDDAPALMCFRSETTEEAFNGIVENVAISIRASQFYSPAYKKIDPDTFCQDIPDKEIGVAAESAASAILTVEI